MGTDPKRPGRPPLGDSPTVSMPVELPLAQRDQFTAAARAAGSPSRSEWVRNACARQAWDEARARARAAKAAGDGA